MTDIAPQQAGNAMSFELQPHLADEAIELRPLVASDFEALYVVAADPLLWAQHPNPQRYQRAVFEQYFEGAMRSGGALLVYRRADGAPIGASRYYDFVSPDVEIAIGYTFLARDCWGRGINGRLKALMLDHAFRFVGRVLFHVGSLNLRSRRAMEKLGARLLGTAPIAYYGEPAHPNVLYEIRRSDWDGRAVQTGAQGGR